MLDNIIFYLMFAMRAMIIATAMLLIGGVLFKLLMPEFFNINGGLVDLRPAKEILSMGFLIITVINFFEVWHRDYKNEYIPNWLR